MQVGKLNERSLWLSENLAMPELFVICQLPVAICHLSFLIPES